MEKRKLLTIGVVIATFFAGLAVGLLSEEMAGVFGKGEDDGIMDVSKDPYSVDIQPLDFAGVVDNPYFPLKPGTRQVYESVSGSATERIEVVVMNETKVVMGIICIVVRDTVRVNGEIIEETYDWYAQDKNGNVWYMGEDSTEYENGVAISKAGSWEGGVDGALPGIIMFANPLSGMTYRQEFYAGEAEDMATVIITGVSVTVSTGVYSGCIKTKDWTPLDPSIVEYKHYAPGIGLVLEESLDGSERVEQVEYVAG